jgi:hypothetical protein
METARGHGYVSISSGRRKMLGDKQTVTIGLAAIRAALEVSGVAFIEGNGRGLGVRLRMKEVSR